MHLAGLAVEAQGHHLVAVADLQRLGLHLPLHPGHALGLLGAEAEREAHAVLGDHQADLARLGVALVGRLDDLHPVAGVEVACRVVVHIGQVAQVLAGVGCRRLDRRMARQALPGRGARRLQRGHALAPQAVERAGRHEGQGAAARQAELAQAEDRAAELAELLAQRGLGLRRLLRAGQGAVQAHAGAVAVFVLQAQAQAGGVPAQLQVQGDAAFGRGLVEQPVPGAVAVAVQGGAGAQVLEVGAGLRRPDAPAVGAGLAQGCGAALAVGRGGVGRQALGAVHRQAHQLGLQVEVAQAVAIAQGQAGGQGQVEGLLAHGQHLAHRQAGVLGRVEGADVDLAAGGEVVGRAAVEVALRVRREAEAAAAGGGRLQRPAAFLQQPVDQLPVVRGEVLDIAQVLVAALDLEAAHARIDQRGQVGRLVVVLEREHMLVVRHDAAGRVRHRVGQAALLRAVAAVGAAPGVGMADEALPAVGHAQRAVHEELHRRMVQGLGAGSDLRQRQLARQHQLREAGVLQEARLLRRADVALRAGMQLDGRQVQRQQAHVLHDQCVHPGVPGLPDHAPRALQLVVAQDGVDGQEDAAAVALRMRAQPRDVRHRIARLVPRAIGRPADVDRVGPVVHGLDADVGIARRGEQFEFGAQGHGGAER